jgi:hypothetical protein
MRTDLEFGGRTVSLDETTVVATASYRLQPALSLTLGAGAILDGAVDTGTSGDLGSGPLAMVAASWLALFETGSRPFAMVSASIAVSTARALSDDGARHRMTAGDGRLGLMVGKTVAERFVPYLQARVFGGPVDFNLAGQDTTGSDAHHYTVGAGVVVRGAAFELFVEAMPLGEQSVGVGLGRQL